jgi:hypothetical protein
VISGVGRGRVFRMTCTAQAKGYVNIPIFRIDVIGNPVDKYDELLE